MFCIVLVNSNGECLTNLRFCKPTRFISALALQGFESIWPVWMKDLQIIIPGYYLKSIAGLR